MGASGGDVPGCIMSLLVFRGTILQMAVDLIPSRATKATLAGHVADCDAGADGAAMLDGLLDEPRRPGGAACPAGLPKGPGGHSAADDHQRGAGPHLPASADQHPDTAVAVHCGPAARAGSQCKDLQPPA